ncbi:MAG TPA: YlcI/YnfO family protein [Burkholderiaceae bacterium]
MKTATLPAVRIAPALRDELESALAEGESLSGFVENAVRESLARRAAQQAFLERGMASLAKARRTGVYVGHDEVMAKLQAKLRTAKRC